MGVRASSGVLVEAGSYLTAVLSAAA